VTKRKVADKPLKTFKPRIRQLTCRSGRRSRAYFRLAQMPKVWRELDQWLRHRLCAIQLKQWKRGTTKYRELLVLEPSLTLRDRWRPTAVAGGATAAFCSTPC
jgi:RNA-directed DNA polymerase